MLFAYIKYNRICIFKKNEKTSGVPHPTVGSIENPVYDPNYTQNGSEYQDVDAMYTDYDYAWK